MNFKKITLACFALMLCAKADAQITSAAPYCDPKLGPVYNMFNTLKVKGSSFSFGPMGSVAKADPFYYYNSLKFPDLVQGDTASFELNVYSVNDVEPIYFAIWIDFDQNKVFNASELVMQNSNTIKKELPVFGKPVTPIKLNITIPATAKPGKTRMRVMRGTNTANPYAPYSATFMLDSCNGSPAAGPNYGCAYDFDVNVKGKGGTSIGEHTPAGQLLFSPNPAMNGTIALTEFARGAALRIADLSGRLMLQQEAINNTTIDVSSFQPGMYFLSLIKDGQSYTQALQISQ